MVFHSFGNFFRVGNSCASYVEVVRDEVNALMDESDDRSQLQMRIEASLKTGLSFPWGTPFVSLFGKRDYVGEPFLLAEEFFDGSLSEDDITSGTYRQVLPVIRARLSRMRTPELIVSYRDACRNGSLSEKEASKRINRLLAADERRRVKIVDRALKRKVGVGLRLFPLKRDIERFVASLPSGKNYLEVASYDPE